MVAFDSEAFRRELKKNQQSKFLLLGDGVMVTQRCIVTGKQIGRAHV